MRLMRPDKKSTAKGLRKATGRCLGLFFELNLNSFQDTLLRIRPIFLNFVENWQKWLQLFFN